MSSLLGNMESVGSHEAPPDPEVLKAVGLSHSLESAIADLVDNSLDAGATRIQVRFVLVDGLVQEFLVIDNGRGMNAQEIGSAMRLGVHRSSNDDSLGHYGMGLKAASFSQADTLTVMSKPSEGPPAGRRLSRHQGSSRFEVEELSDSDVLERFESDFVSTARNSGTVVLWDDIRTFPKAADSSITSAFLETEVSRLRQHLGLVFHRLLERGIFNIEIDVIDLDANEAGLPFEVEPINPFSYRRPGALGYPKVLVASSAQGDVNLNCHIWPPDYDNPHFRVSDALVDQFQGFYLYRHDRLLKYGTWANAAQSSKQRRLARVAVDVDDRPGLFSMSMEKSQVHLSADLARAIELAVADDGTTFADFLAEAESTFKTSNKRVRQRQRLLPPGQGIPPGVKRSLAREVELIEGEEPVKIRWVRMRTSDFLEVDRANRTLKLNDAYRSAVLNGDRGGVNDAPILKALLYLLFEDIFRGQVLGAKDKENVAIWTSVLNAAAREELGSRG